MLQTLLTALFTSVIGGVVGVALTHRFAQSRDKSQKRREIVIPSLIDILYNLDRANTNRHEHDVLALNLALSKAQIFGDKKIVDLCHSLIFEIEKTGEIDTTGLFLDIREKLRAELDLEPIERKYVGLNLKMSNPQS